MFRQRKSGALREGRVSEPYARYFVTWCVANRQPLLTSPLLQQAIREEVAALERGADLSLCAGSIMPDHVHLIVELGERLSLSQTVARIKSSLRRLRPDIRWQENFFEHRVRSNAAEEDFAFYIFMNPYVAGCCSLDQTWPGWISPREFRWSFQGKLRPEGLPQAEWLVRARQFAGTLPAGAD